MKISTGTGDKGTTGLYSGERVYKVDPHFIMPGENYSSSSLHVARTVVRRAERRITELAMKENGVSDNVLKYINRLSDLTYLLAYLEEKP